MDGWMDGGIEWERMGKGGWEWIDGGNDVTGMNEKIYTYLFFFWGGEDMKQNTDAYTSAW
jgi:hypothetical protein